MTAAIVLACLLAAVVIFVVGWYCGVVTAPPEDEQRPRVIVHNFEWLDWRWPR